MSFSFGQTNFGQTQKPTGFGTPFGATTTTASGFGGGFGSSFGTPAQSTPAFGTSFGTPATSAAPAFGGTFGTPASAVPAFGSSFGTPATAAPAFGTSFGTPATSAPAFGAGFGTPNQTAATPSLFGSAQTTKPSLFGTPASTGNLFSTPGNTGGGLFGAPAATQQQAPSLFGTTTTAAPSLFGTAATTTTPSLFGTSFGTATTTSGGLFGGTNTFGTGGGLFGTTATTSTAPSLFGGFGATNTAPGTNFGGFGAGTATSTGGPGFGLFGSGTGSNLFGNTLGQKPSAPTGVPTVESKLQQTLASFYAINVFGDERDDILKKWNMLQACWGTGKAYYNASQPPIEYNSTNPFYRFKAIGYVVIPQPDNTDGLVKLHFNKKESELNGMKQSLINGINGILGNKPNLTVTIEHIKGLAETESEVMITVSEKGVTGTSRKIHASDLAAFLNQPAQKQQLTSVGVTFIGPYMTPSRAQLEEYLKIPPPGIDNQMWQAAQIDNPHPQKYLPTPMNGFSDLKKRMLCEEYETGLHRAFLEKVTNDINELKRKQAASIAQINEYKQKFIQLQHRVLKILVKQEVTRKVGMALQPEEEILRSRLEFMHSQLSVPTQFKGQLNELVSSVRIMDALEKSNHNESYKIDPKVQEDLKQFLEMEQNGISHLINIINTDLKNLKLIQDGLTNFINK